MDGLIVINHLPLDDGNYDFMDKYDFITLERKPTWKETLAEIEEVRRAVIEDVADELIYYIFYRITFKLCFNITTSPICMNFKVI